MKHKTVFSWIVLVFSGIIGVIGVIGFFMSIINRISGSGIPPALMTYVVDIIIVIGAFFFLILASKIYYVKSDLSKWVNITFGYQMATLVVYILYVLIVYGLLGILGLFAAFPVIVITATIWLFFGKHIKKAKTEKIMDFS